VTVKGNDAPAALGVGRVPNRHGAARSWGRGLGATALAAVLLSGVGWAQDTVFFRVGGGPSDGSYFGVATLIAKVISNPPGSPTCEEGGSCGVPGLIAAAVSTEGSAENVAAVAAGRLESALAQTNVVSWAYNAAGPYQGKPRLTNIAAIANLFPESVHVVVRADSGIRTVRDLKDKRVSLGPKGSGTASDARLILEAYGVPLKSVKASYLATGPAADLLGTGEIDALFTVAAYPMVAIDELAKTADVRLLALDGKEAGRLAKKHPYYSFGVIPRGSYQGVGDTMTLTVSAQLIVMKNAPEELVYGITRALWHERSRALLDRGAPEGRRIRIENALLGVGIPLHPGASRFYREIGAATRPTP